MSPEQFLTVPFNNKTLKTCFFFLVSKKKKPFDTLIPKITNGSDNHLKDTMS